MDPVLLSIIFNQLKMKKIIIFPIALFFSLVIFHTASGRAKFDPAFYNQDSSKQLAACPLLTLYYDIKNALVKSDAGTASQKAGAFVTNIQNMDPVKLPENVRQTFLSLQPKLRADAEDISKSKDIEKQRMYFKNLSDHFYLFAKAGKICDGPVYRQYCPMKKSYWLSNETSIRNPYYGAAMLTCGQLTDTLK
jgi:Protein of unknown function (DUF3347)